MSLLAGLALALLTAAPSPAPKPQTPVAFEPCRGALPLVRQALRTVPPGLASWPLYELELEVNPEGGTVAGRFQVSFAAELEGTEVVLVPPVGRETGGFLPLRVPWAAAVVGEGEPEAAPFEADGHRISVRLPRAPRRGERVAVRLALEGELPRLEAGSFEDAVSALTTSAELGVVGGLSTDGHRATLLTMHPVLAPVRQQQWWAVPPARYGAAPPAPPACVLTSLLAPAGLVALGSGQQIGEVPEGEGRVRHVFVAAGTRRAGIVLAPRTLRQVLREVGPVKVRVSAGEAARAKELASIATKALPHLEARYGQYPWARLEVVTAPITGAFAGLRGPGLVLVNELLEESQSSVLAMVAGETANADLREAAVVHQLAHQWFGELVATPGPDQPCLEELLAHHAMLDYARARFGAKSAEALQRSLLDPAYQLHRALGSPDGAADRPLVELGGVGGWSALCEGKAPRLLRALEGLLGVGPVRRILRGWVRAHRWGIGDRASLEAAFVAGAPKASAAATRALFVRWLDETHGDEDVGLGDPFAMGGMPDLALPPGMDAEDMQQLWEAFSRMLGGQFP